MLSPLKYACGIIVIRWRNCIMRSVIMCAVNLIMKRRKGLAENVAHMGEMRNIFKILFGKSERNLGDLNVNWGILLK
jgi:hypothetical protein